MSNKLKFMFYAALPYQQTIQAVILMSLMLAPAGLIALW